MTSGLSFIPLAFWLGFLALGFVTSFGGPTKTHQTKEAVALESGRGGQVPRTARD
ncbi:hypothetical protein [Methylocystis parvus]|uniref:hypothetical protein n=1 Tax=Methylocystis parvus TaxID=134 RepID=UPI0002D3AD1E|nr:hypothetical protein [Methylocystis parvus]WBK00023.1 hypothetical protein MMG94_18925 [Methylocystis parvus OBBP]